MEIVRRWAWPVFWATFLFRGVTLFIDVSRTTERVAWLLGFVALGVALLASSRRLRAPEVQRDSSTD